MSRQWPISSRQCENDHIGQRRLGSDHRRPDGVEGAAAKSTTRVDVRVGEAVSTGDRIITVWPDPGDEWHGESHIRRSITTAHERSLLLDPTFGIRQLVDIALRALSSGVNDQTTAVDVVHHLKTPVRTVLLSDAPLRIFAGPDRRKVFLSRAPGKVRLCPRRVLGDPARRGQTAICAPGSPRSARRLAEGSRTGGHEQRGGAVTEELELTLAMARSSHLPESDLRRVLEEWASRDFLEDDDLSE